MGLRAAARVSFTVETTVLPSFALPRGSCKWEGPSSGMTHFSTTNGSNFHEWEAASPEILLVGFIRVYSGYSWFKNIWAGWGGRSGSTPSVFDIWAMRDDGPAPRILECLGEFLERGTADRGAQQGLQLGGIGDQLDFFAQTLRNSIESNFQGFEDSGSVGSDESLLTAFFAAFLATFLTAFLTTFLAELFGE
jgi:hypothetical protein